MGFDQRLFARFSWSSANFGNRSAFTPQRNVTKTLRTLVISFSTMLALLSYGFLLRPIQYQPQSLGISIFHIPPPVLFRKRPLIIWSNEWHIAPIYDVRTFLEPFGVRVLDNNLAHNCDITQNCAQLKVINFENVMNLTEPDMIRRFYEAYVNDARMKSVDAFICMHPDTVCELFERFKKPMIIISTLRYEVGRHSAKRWKIWNKHLLSYAANPRNVIAANNPYDVQYMKYFTGYTPRLIRSFCNYTGVRYNATRPGYIVAGAKRKMGLRKVVMGEYQSVCRRRNCSVEMFNLRTKYGAHYEYSDIAAHQGIIYVPYQVSVMSFYEQYRMNIPLFVPSVNLLTYWQFKYWAMRERTWEGTYTDQPPTQSVLPPHQSQAHIPDPNNEIDMEAIRYWIKFADYYNFPHVIIYESIADLVGKIHNITTDELRMISRNMQRHNEEEEKRLISIWTDILLNVGLHSPNDPH